MSLYPSSKYQPPVGLTEFEILKASHKFLREDTGENTKSLSWNEQLALKYYASLYREFAVCDLKHYKSGNFALRWRTESEVLSGAGETTCGNTRCSKHGRSGPGPLLTTLELPFAYTEHGEHKSALVKVVLCDRCVKKLLWKRRKEKAGIPEGGEDSAVDTKKEERGGEDGDLRKDRGRRAETGDTVVKREHQTPRLPSTAGSDVEDGMERRRRDGKRYTHRKREQEREDTNDRRRERSSRSRSPRARDPERYRY